MERTSTKETGSPLVLGAGKLVTSQSNEHLTDTELWLAGLGLLAPDKSDHLIRCQECHTLFEGMIG